MKQVEVRKQLAKARAGLYRFLGGLYIMEVEPLRMPVHP